MLSAAGISARVLVTEIISSSRTWVAPSTTTTIEVAAGYGGAGSPSRTIKPSYSDHVTTTWFARPGASSYLEEGGTYYYDGQSSDYCEPFVEDNFSTVYTGYRTCHDITNFAGGTTDPTTGTALTAFGKSFPGGFGGPTTTPTATFNNIAITPGGSYAISVPTGGSLTITYYK